MTGIGARSCPAACARSNLAALGPIAVGPLLAGKIAIAAPPDAPDLGADRNGTDDEEVDTAN